MKLLLYSLFFFFLAFEMAHAQKMDGGTKRRTQASYQAPSSATTSQKPLQVKGQTRALSMGLTLKNEKEKIDHIKPRDNFDEEIKDTNY